MNSKANTMRTATPGAAGYTGAELVRLLLHHPSVEIRALTADRNAGNEYGAVFPHLGGRGLPKLIKIADVDYSNIDLVFCCLPHGETQEVISKLPTHLPLIHLSLPGHVVARARTQLQVHAREYGQATATADQQPRLRLAHGPDQQ